MVESGDQERLQIIAGKEKTSRKVVEIKKSDAGASSFVIPEGGGRSRQGMERNGSKGIFPR